MVPLSHPQPTKRMGARKQPIHFSELPTELSDGLFVSVFYFSSASPNLFTASSLAPFLTHQWCHSPSFHKDTESLPVPSHIHKLPVEGSKCEFALLLLVFPCNFPVFSMRLFPFNVLPSDATLFHSSEHLKVSHVLLSNSKFSSQNLLIVSEIF